MAQIDNAQAVKGRLIRIENTQQSVHKNEAEIYVAVYVEDANGSNTRCIMLTEGELQRAEKRAVKNDEDQPKLVTKGFFSRLFNL